MDSYVCKLFRTPCQAVQGCGRLPFKIYQTGAGGEIFNFLHILFKQCFIILINNSNIMAKMF